MIAPTSERLGILTIDVEEWFHAHNYADKMDTSTWDGIDRRAEGGVDRLLDMCDELDIRGTFFVLGWLAERAPELVKKIAAAGHEIGCHSHRHPVIYDIDPDTFREDTVRARDALGEVLGYTPTMYRAPSFTIVPRSYWALEILAEEGFRIDSSLFPVAHPRYGNARGPRHPFRLGDADDGLLVLPMTTLRLLGVNLPFSGGGYFRLLPAPILHRCAKRVQERQREPVVYYFHPWELDSYRPDVDLGWLQNVRSQGGKQDLYTKLSTALQGQTMVGLGEWAETVRASAPKIGSVAEI